MTGRRAGRDLQEYLEITLTNVLIASYQQSGANGTDVPTDQVSLSCTKIQIEYREIKQDGSLGGPVTGGSDVKANSRV
jgi:type VI secretion system secreted protein Hcp